MTKIHPLTIARQSYALLWQNRLTAGAFWFAYVLAYTLAGMVPLYHLVPVPHVFYKLLTSLLLAPAAVVFYQTLLAPPDEPSLLIPHDIVKKALFFTVGLFSVKILYFLVYSSLTGLISPPADPEVAERMTAVMAVMGYAIPAVFYYCAVKTALFFPAVVQGRDSPLATAYTLTRGNTLWVFLGLAMALAPAYVLVTGLLLGPGANLIFWLGDLRLPLWLQTIYMNATGAVFDGLLFMLIAAGLCAAYVKLLSAPGINAETDEPTPAKENHQ